MPTRACAIRGAARANLLAADPNQPLASLLEGREPNGDSPVPSPGWRC